MYKKQLGFQRIVCLIAIIAAAISFIYSLGLITDIYDSLYPTMMNPNDLTQTYVPGSIIYYDMQDFNKQLVSVNIGLILLACLLFITNTHSRRKYYIGNFVSTGLYCVAAVAAAVWSSIQISAFRVQYLTTVDFEALKTFSEMLKTPYIDSTLMLDLNYAVAGLTVLAAAALIINLVWKLNMMRQERKLLDDGREAKL